MKGFAWRVTVLVVPLAIAVTDFGLAQTRFTPPESPRRTFNFNPGWKFFKGDAINANKPEFDDSSWASVSAPHTYNDTDTYDELISHSGGERHQYMGVAWYRKHFKLPTSAGDGKVFLEFEGLKQAGRFWVNSEFAGRFENGSLPLAWISRRSSGLARRTTSLRSK